MAFSNDTSGMVMPVSPMYGGGYGGGFGGFGGDNAWWVIILLLCGWGGGFGGGFGGWGGMMGMGMEFPWILNGQNNLSGQMNDGFRTAQLSDSVTSIGDRLASMSTQICDCCGQTQMAIAGVNQNICQTGNGIVNALNNGFNSAEIAANSRQMANMQQAFNAQTANMQGFNGVQAGIADLRYTEATENCATRTASAQNTRDIIDAQTRGTQAILDKLCALELDNVKSQLAAAQRENVGLQNQVNMATMRESQTAQTAQILAGQAAEIDGVYNRLKNCPVPSMPVYGNTPIFTCPQNAYNPGCGCGCNC